jgi:hypothetical protein
MKTLAKAALGAILLTAIAFPGRAQNIVVWRTIIGIEQAGNVVGGITGVASLGLRTRVRPWSSSPAALSCSR